MTLEVFKAMLLKALASMGLEEFRKFYSYYDGTVVKPNEDGTINLLVPEISRVTMKNVPALMGNLGPDEGSAMVPKKGANVVVMFKMGDVNHPRYLPGASNKASSTGATQKATIRFIQSEKIRIELNDETGKWSVQVRGTAHKWELDEAGLALLAAASIKLGEAGLTAALDGVVTKQAICAYTGAPHADASTVVMAKKGP